MKKIILSFVVFVLLVTCALGIYAYNHYCENELREVDRYAQPYIINAMEVISTWNYSEIKPYLDSEYDESLSSEEWIIELEKLSKLGELYSFGRPSFVKHSPYTKYFVCESAIEFYSIAAEFEHANAVVRFLFENNCGKLTIKNLAVTSEFLEPEPIEPEIQPSDENVEKLEELLNDDLTYSDEDLEIDIEQDDFSSDNAMPEETQSKETTIKKESKPKSKSKSYSW